VDRQGDGEPNQRERALYYLCIIIDSFFYVAATKKSRKNSIFKFVTKKEQIQGASSDLKPQATRREREKTIDVNALRRDEGCQRAKRAVKVERAGEAK
jgi:hypothetical protein